MFTPETYALHYTITRFNLHDSLSLFLSSKLVRLVRRRRRGARDMHHTYVLDSSFVRGRVDLTRQSLTKGVALSVPLFKSISFPSYVILNRSLRYREIHDERERDGGP